MKNLVILITLVFALLPLKASNEIIYKKDASTILNSNLDTDLDIFKIKQDIETRNRVYYMTGSFTVIKTPTGRESDVAHTVDISFRNATIKSSGERNNYIQANAQAIRNDNNTINEFRIYIPHGSGEDGSVDERNIKVNWKTGSIEVVDKLDNVSIIYKEHTILIIGTMEKNGYTIGVSLALAKKQIEITHEIEPHNVQPRKN
ncbi:hypothetical protein [Winogradskyella costae]|uniref:hypothetical protein n=1 Tax=Winogradskyella costae TaxID=2697008 RepID=UPI0015CC8A3D|nr:hypothetical protein [Winogradskyella costae]